MEYPKTPSNTVKRDRKKVQYDKNSIHSIMDANETCTVAFNIDGKAQVQPINFGRTGDFLYLHGNVKNRMTSALVKAGEVCLNVMSLDALKLTKSAYHHSVNYRSVVIFGEVRELIKKREAKQEIENPSHVVDVLYGLILFVVLSRDRKKRPG